MITASHNKPAYNGYKVYWDDGSQIIAPVDKDITSEVKAITDYKMIKKISRKDAEEKAKGREEGFKGRTENHESREEG